MLTKLEILYIVERLNEYYNSLRKEFDKLTIEYKKSEKKLISLLNS